MQDRDHNIKIADKFLKNVAKFKYLGMTETNQNYIHDKIKSRLKMWNASHHSVLNLLSSHIFSRNAKIKMYKTTVLPYEIFMVVKVWIVFFSGF
jgi:hypothetical protein